MRDFVSAVPGLIAGLVGAALSGELQKSTIAAGGNVVLNLNFGLGIDQALRVIQRVIPQLVESQLQRGRPRWSSRSLAKARSSSTCPAAVASA